MCLRQTFKRPPFVGRFGFDLSELPGICASPARDLLIALSANLSALIEEERNMPTNPVAALCTQIRQRSGSSIRFKAFVTTLTSALLVALSFVVGTATAHAQTMETMCVSASSPNAPFSRCEIVVR